MRTRLALLVMLVTILAAAVSVTEARAAAGITVTGGGARVSFPSGVTFTLDAESSAEITDVTLLLNTPNQRYGAYTRNVRPDFRPGERVSASWTWRRSGSSLPPGADVSYQWRLTDATGQTLETELAVIRVDDNRFQWQELREGLLTVRWYRGDERFGREMLGSVTEAVRRLSAEQGVDLSAPVTVHVYGSSDDLRGALPGLPGWVGGVSLGEWDSVLVPVPPRDLSNGRRALIHELTHQLIYQITFHPSLGSRVPAWLNEGLAVVSEGATTRENREALLRALTARSLPTLRSLGNSFSALPGEQAQLHYAASESVIRFLLDTEGADRMRVLLAEFRQGRTADDALRAVYGRGVDQTEDQWRISLGLRPLDRGQGEQAPPTAPDPAAGQGGAASTWLVFAGAASITLTLIGALVLGLLLVRRGRKVAT
jgi:hypothetical protein